MRAYTGAITSVSPCSLTNSPATYDMNFCISRFDFSCWLMQAASVRQTSAVTTDASRFFGFMRAFIRRPSSIIGAPLCLITRAEREHFLQQLRVLDARGARRLREVLFLGEVRIRIRLDDVDLSVRVHAVVETRAAGEPETSIDAA